MKKKIMLLMMVLVLAVSVFAGCGSKESNAEQTLTGTFMDKKDFMFTVQDAEGTYYGFAFQVKPENYSDLNNGDYVTVTYTGKVSEVDPFDGEIISIEKLK
ncbi:MAG: hypothetical protein U0M69_02955 [Lachnospiraceae bacterium]|nr:hypothetical protein [Lachnospiraceae bacterium]MEE1014961.1 hypothetical protein [Lachnospiraceae bacterium]